MKENCPLCARAKIHARKHGNNKGYILCLPHRIVAWITENAYNPKNVDWRNPLSANKYVIKDHYNCDLYNIIYKNIKCINIPEFAFEIIARGREWLWVDYAPYGTFKCSGIFLPIVISNIREGEYEDRQFVILYFITFPKKRWDVGWGILFHDNIVDDFLNYYGLGNIEGVIDTNSSGKAVAKDPTAVNKIKYFRQRISCKKC